MGILLGEGSDYTTIPNGLPIYVMRHLIETRSTLSQEGDIYVGTGSSVSMSQSIYGQFYDYYRTTDLYTVKPYDPTQIHDVLQYDSSTGFYYSKLSLDNISDIYASFSLDSSLILDAAKFAPTLQLDVSQIHADGTLPYGWLTSSVSTTTLLGLSTVSFSAGAMIMLMSWEPSTSRNNFDYYNLGVIRLPTFDELSWNSAVCYIHPWARGWAPMSNAASMWVSQVCFTAFSSDGFIHLQTSSTQFRSSVMFTIISLY